MWDSMLALAGTRTLLEAQWVGRLAGLARSGMGRLHGRCSERTRERVDVCDGGVMCGVCEECVGLKWQRERDCVCGWHIQSVYVCE